MKRTPDSAKTCPFEDERTEDTSSDAVQRSHSYDQSKDFSKGGSRSRNMRVEVSGSAQRPEADGRTINHMHAGIGVFQAYLLRPSADVFTVQAGLQRASVRLAA